MERRGGREEEEKKKERGCRCECLKKRKKGGCVREIVE